LNFGANLNLLNKSPQALALCKVNTHVIFAADCISTEGNILAEINF
jgi:hypothetical protein